MIGLGISILWFLVGVAVLAGVVYLVFWFVRTVLNTAIPAKIEQIVWVIVLLLVLIGLLTLLAGGSPFPRLR